MGTQHWYTVARKVQLLPSAYGFCTIIKMKVGKSNHCRFEDCPAHDPNFCLEGCSFICSHSWAQPHEMSLWYPMAVLQIKNETRILSFTTWSHDPRDVALQAGM